MKRILSIAVFLMLLLSSFYVKAQEEVNMLFIGNSFTFRHNIDLLIKELMLEKDPNLRIYTEKQVYGGQSLFQHTELYNTHTFIEQSSIENSVIEQRIAEMRQFLELPEPPSFWNHYYEEVKGKTPPDLPTGNIEIAIRRHENLLENNPRRRWDYVVFQSWVDVYPDLNEAYAKYVKFLGKIAREQGAKVILYATAPDYQNKEAVDGPLKQEQLEEEMDIFLSLAQDFEPFAVVPVPQAINNIQQGGTDLTFRYLSDFHPNQRSAFLTANMFYTAITKESPEGFNFNSVTETHSKYKDLGQDPDGGPLTMVFEEEEKVYLQQTAYNTVMDFEELWKGTGEVQLRGISISNAPVYPLMLGEELMLLATTYPTYAKATDLLWELISGSAVSIDSTGFVKTLALGTAKIRVTTNDGGFTDSCIVEVVEKPYQAAYSLSKGKIPGLIEAEYYDEGGQGVAYNDDDSKAGSQSTRSGENVDIVAKASASNGYTVGYTVRGEWLEYTVDVETGIYDIVFYYNCGNSFAGKLEVRLDNKILTNFSGFVNNGWNVADSQKVEQISIEGGEEKIMRLSVPGNAGFNIDAIKFIKVPEKVGVNGVSLSGCPDSEMLVGDDQQLTVAVIPDDATDTGVSWTSSDEEIVKVDENGLVTAMSAGEVSITVASSDGGYTDVCILSALEPVIEVSSVSISNPPADSLQKEETYQFEVIVHPEDASNKRVSWSSSDESIATIDAEGLLTALGIGNAVITATAEDGYFADSCIITVVNKTSKTKYFQNADDEISMSFNAAYKEIHLTFEKKNENRTVRIANSSGHILHKDIARELTKTIDIREFQNRGIIFIQLVWPDMVKTYKIVN